MASVCFYFQVHQPMRVKRYSIFQIGKDGEYFNDGGAGNLNNQKILHKVSEKCYLPANSVLLKLLNTYKQFKISFSFSGIVLDQLQRVRSDVLESFQQLVDTGRVEVLSETYYHSLSFLYSLSEFKEQILLHGKKVKKLFGYTPSVFRNTELIYNNELGAFIAQMGYKGMLAEGADHILGWRSPNFLYHPLSSKKIKLLLKNYRLSDDIAFRFSSRDWSEYPLTAPKFAQWVNAINGNGNVVNLFMDYETFGEHQWEDTGIFEFLKVLPGEILKYPDNDFVTPSEAIDRYPAVGEFDALSYVSWADIERDLSAWRSNPIQHDAASKLYELEKEVKSTGDNALLEDWRRLTSSDHFYYMCTKWFADGDVHKYFNPHESPYEAFISFMNVLQDLKLRINQKTSVPKGTTNIKNQKYPFDKLRAGISKIKNI